MERKLILHEFKSAGFSMPESVIDGAVESEIERGFGGDRLDLTRTLKAQGRTFESFRQQVSDDFIIGAMRRYKLSDENIMVSPHKIEKYYAENLDKFKVGDQYKLRIMMIRMGGKGSPDAARELAAEIARKLDEGASFETMAGIYSEDANRSKGGDRGWVELEKEHYHSELEEAIRSLAVGEHSGVIEAGEAFWLVQVDDAKTDHIKTLSEVRDEIEQTLIQEEQARRLERWVERLKAKSFVRYF